MRASFALALLAVAGCFSPNYGNGSLQCAPGSRCPSGYHCAYDNKCWQASSNPPVANKNQGDACGPDDVCATGHCVDGFCCDTACDGACQACDVTPGSCGTVAGTPHGARSCVGQGTSCLGTCDGSAKDCTYPPASSICGAACDGKCDGAGHCSSQAGGTCPNGFACGASGCLTSCSQPTDCQVNFTCTNSMCVRVPESDCLDGKDNNGDNLADCADPTCQAQVTCVPVGPGGSQIGVVSNACPGGYGPATPELTGFQDSTCTGCGCKTTPVCAAEADLRGSAGCNGTYLPLTVSGPAGGALSPCTAANGAAYLQVYVFPASTTGRNCSVLGAPSRVNPTFSVSTSFCPASRTSPTCAGANQVCVPALPTTATACVAMPGSVTCPAGYATNPPTYYYQGASKGACASCPGSCSGGGVGCSGGVSVYAYSGASCVGTSYGPSGQNVCSTLSGAAVTINGLAATFTADGAADTCTVSQPATTPSTLIGESTICCM